MEMEMMRTKQWSDNSIEEVLLRQVDGKEDLLIQVIQDQTLHFQDLDRIS